ncbi:DUF2206 domain-containing protein [Methanobacterium veterum]|uniref:DUF2206 domain-containing protein n=1 Tax=Methanobacterium veterum TaxID=408577 RepID=A0A9E5A832_9EURY|nr:DUF2206 domain-containing protein [Methanobacterium veterum]MCZ3367499.1 DUF2206 domain-containing protein [Methanobacterium veterum]MCZ3373353.1 DUF2206 domain-containing protein [Methanobacterium veterum]
MLNPLEMNDWDIKTFFSTILILQVLFLGFFLLNQLGINIPIIKEITALISIIFVPGILFLRTLGLHKLGSLKTLLFTMGSSLSLVMVIGFLLNVILLKFFTDPLTPTNMILTLLILQISLSILAYINDKNYSNPSFIEIHYIKSPFLYLSILLLPLVIIGTYCINHFSLNYLIEIYILLIPVLVLAVVFDKISPKFYPLIIFMISLSLLYHNSLISNYIWGWDIMGEYKLANLVITQSFWDYNAPMTCNAMLSTTLLPSFFTKVVGLNLVWVYKIIFPLIFSLTPVGIYEIAKKLTSKKIGFLSSFFFMSFYVFFIEMFQLPRQQIAELFLILILILMLEEKIKYKMTILFVLFSFSVVVSHYATSYIVIFIFLLALLIFKGIKYLKYVLNKSSFPFVQNLKIMDFSGTLNYRLNFNYLLLFIGMAVVWYIYISSSINFNTFVSISDHIITNLRDEFLSTSSTQSIYLITRNQTVLQNIEKYLDIISQFCVFAGLIGIFLKFKEYKFNSTYLSIASAAFLVAVAGMIVPNFASTINTSRLYHITLIFLAPFCVIGGTLLLKKLFRLKNRDTALKIFSIFLIVFFLFNSKIIYEVTSYDAPSPGLNPNYDFPLFNEMEVSGANWLSQFQEIKLYSDIPSKNGTKMYRETYYYADGYRNLLLTSEGIKVQAIPSDFNSIPKESYLFLGTKNIKEKEMLFSKPPFTFYYESSNGLFNNRNKIYDNGGSQIFY